MKINSIENLKRKKVFQIEGEDHTLCNILVDELLQDENIVCASYKVEHPLVGIPQVIVETNDKETAKQALNSAVKRLKKKISEFGKKFDDAE